MSSNHNHNDGLILPERLAAERAPKVAVQWLITIELTTLQEKRNDDGTVVYLPIVVRESVISDVSPLVYLSQKRYVEVGVDENGPIEWAKCVVLFSEKYAFVEENAPAANQKIIGA